MEEGRDPKEIPIPEGLPDPETTRILKNAREKEKDRRGFEEFFERTRSKHWYDTIPAAEKADGKQIS